jgi:hypothetical protein
MAAVRGNGNKTTERRLQLGLVRPGIRGWTLHHKSTARQPEFFFPEHGIAVFVDAASGTVAQSAAMSRVQPR